VVSGDGREEFWRGKDGMGGEDCRAASNAKPKEAQDSARLLSGTFDSRPIAIGSTSHAPEVIGGGPAGE